MAPQLFTRRSALLAVLSGCILLSGLTGCWLNSPPPKDEAFTDFHEIGRAYSFIIGQKNRPPKSVAEIREVLENLHQAGLVGEPSKAMLSSRDGEPYVIILGAPLGEIVSNDILAYEQKGKEGHRYVLRMSREIDLISDEVFAQSTFIKNHKPEGM